MGSVQCLNGRLVRGACRRKCFLWAVMEGALGWGVDVSARAGDAGGEDRAEGDGSPRALGSNRRARGCAHAVSRPTNSVAQGAGLLQQFGRRIWSPRGLGSYKRAMGPRSHTVWSCNPTLRLPVGPALRSNITTDHQFWWMRRPPCIHSTNTASSDSASRMRSGRRGNS